MSGIIGVSPDMRSGVIGAWPSGHVIQTVVDTDTGTTRLTTSTDYEDIAGLSCELTNTNLNSKFLISYSTSMASNNTTNELRMNIKRVDGDGTTDELQNNTYGLAHKRTDWGSLAFFYLDSPSQAQGTTITYSLRFKVDSGTAYSAHSGGWCTLMVQEIAA